MTGLKACTALGAEMTLPLNETEFKRTFGVINASGMVLKRIYIFSKLFNK